MLLRHASSLVLVAVVGCSSGESGTSCDVDTDCSLNERCSSGRCVSIQSGFDGGTPSDTGPRPRVDTGVEPQDSGASGTPDATVDAPVAFAACQDLEGHWLLSDSCGSFTGGEVWLSVTVDDGCTLVMEGDLSGTLSYDGHGGVVATSLAGGASECPGTVTGTEGGYQITLDCAVLIGWEQGCSIVLAQ